MNLRIKSHTVRFRITLDEMDEFAKNGLLVDETLIPGGDSTNSFRFEIQHSPENEASEFTIQPYGMRLVLNGPDFAELADATKDGVYIRREHCNEDGKTHRFVVYVEKDKGKKKASRASKPPVREKGTIWDL